MIKEIWINDIPAPVYETGGRRYFSKEWNAGKVPLFRREILETNRVNCLLPVSFFREEGRQLVSWDITSYLPLRDHIARKRMSRWLCFTDEVLAVLQKIIAAMRECEDHLLFTDGMCISVDTVFIHSRGADIKLVFEPTEERCSFAEVFQALLRDLNELAKDREWSVYGAKLQKELEHNNPGFTAMQKVLAVLQQELAGTRWNGTPD